MKLFLSTLLMSVAMCATAQIKVSEHSGRHSLSLTEARIYVSPADAEVVKRSARMLADDVMAVSGCRPQVQVSDNPKSRLAVIAGTIGQSPLIGNHGDSTEDLRVQGIRGNDAREHLPRVGLTGQRIPDVAAV